ncbi:MAG: hypothetical protein FWG47_05010 [Propionibacteriaceae bacterium]|nr:hypothetical protein [Propionibacteriaceae bacterium]
MARGGTSRLGKTGRIEWELDWEARAGDASGAVDALASSIASRAGSGYEAISTRIISGSGGLRAAAAVVASGAAAKREAKYHTLANMT